jgi:hypothetical protein
MENEHDPYKVLCLERNFTLEQLKNNYKRLALQLHPDKCPLDVSTSTTIFQILTRAYKSLLREYESTRVADKTFNELKAPYSKPQDYNTSSQSQQMQQQPIMTSTAGSKGFDATKFNAFFSTHRIKMPEDEGYNAWIASGETGRSHAHSKEHRSLIKYTQPEPVHIVKSIAFCELGIDKIDDFSKPPSSTDRRSALQFTDYRIAHTTSNLVDTSKIKERRTYRTVRELEAARAQELRQKMTAAEAQMHATAARRREDLEEQRLHSMRRFDDEAAASLASRSFPMSRG